MHPAARPSWTTAPWLAVGSAAVVAAAATAVVSLSPAVRFAYRAPELHVSLETANAVIALLVGVLFAGRHRASGSAADLLVALSLCTVAVANLVLTALPQALLADRGVQLTLWAPVAVRFGGTLLLLAAAVTPQRVLTRRRARGPVLLVAGAVLLAVAAAAALGDRIPPPIEPGVGVAAAARPLVTGHWLLLAVQAVGALLYGVAAVAFSRRGARTGDELLSWLGLGCVFAAFARLNYLLFPSLYTDYVYAGDLLRLLFYGCLLAGAGREISSYWEVRARAAVLEDRRRMARELHDGLTQELAYIWSQSRVLARTPDAATAERIGGAAGRALDEARRAVAALTRPLDEPFPVVLQQLVEDMASRYDVAVRTELDADAAPTPEQATEMLRIAGEAMRNAAVHGGAASVQVRLTAVPLGLHVCDDGAGFDPATLRPGAFGLTSMQERAAAVRASFAVTSAPGEGASVQLEWQ